MKRQIKTLALGMGLLGAMCLTALPDAVQAAYPTEKPIRMIVPLAAGSSVDKAARVVTQHMSNTLGQSIVVENLPGASGLIGAERVAKAEPDGYTIGGFNDSILTMVPHMHKTMPWDPIKDFDPISLVGTIEWGLIVPARSSIESPADLIEQAKANAGKMTYSSGGVGSPQHIAMAMFLSKAGAQMMHVPYKGATPGAIAVAAGEVEAGFQGLAAALGLVQSGKAKLVAVTTKDRMPQFPDTPTVAESGLENFTFDSWFLMVAPKGTDSAIIEKLNEAVRLALQDEGVAAQLIASGLTPRGSSAQELGEATKTNLEVYRKLIRDSGIQPE